MIFLCRVKRASRYDKAYCSYYF